MPNWTTDQLRAMQPCASDMLVAAAAGSGKTAVLVERVLRQVTHPTHPVDIDGFLIVTFTAAAAAELRGKLADALRERLAQAPNNAHLRRQTLRVHQAPISTVHAFCMHLIREHAATLALPLDFRMLDESETTLIAQEVLEQVIEAAYTQATPDFLAACELLNSARNDDNLVQTVQDIAKQLQAQPNPQAAVQQLLHQLDSTDTVDRCATELVQALQSSVTYGLQVLDYALRVLGELSEDDSMVGAYRPALVKDIAQAQALQQILAQVPDAPPIPPTILHDDAQNTQDPQAVQIPAPADWQDYWERITAASVFPYQKLGTLRGYEDAALQAYVKDLREAWKDTVKRIRRDIVRILPSSIYADHDATAPALRGILQLVDDYFTALATTKRRRGVLSFSDLEHFAVELLYDPADPEGVPAPSLLANQLRAQYVGVLVDEYQDTNEVQDAIFAAVGAGKRFLVGDVKQSIYRFRLANPYIFLRKYHQFQDAPPLPEVDEGDNPPPEAPTQAQTDGEGTRVVLSKNFRSRAQVLDAVNYIFENVMSERVGDLDYTAQERLYVGANYFPETQPHANDTELLLADLGDNPTKLDAIAGEARMVARRLRQMLDEGYAVFDGTVGAMRPMRLGDVCLLMRSLGSRIATWRTEFEQYGLHLAEIADGNLLTTVEVRTMLSLLEIIDNPEQDVALVGVLRAPLFGFTEHMLAQIRLCNREGSLYQALQLAAPTLPEAAAFVDFLQQLRLLACDLPVYRLLWHIYHHTNALAVYGAQQNGAVRQQNLMALLDRARATEQAGNGGLFRFVSRLRAMLDNGQDVKVAQAEAGDGIRVMTIHKSKGLEFPIVVLADTAHIFNESDRYNQVLLHNDYGLVSKRRDMQASARFETMERLAVNQRMRAENLSEEMRLLYVALTRAKEKLIISGAVKLSSALPDWVRLAQMATPIPSDALARANTILPWIAAPLMRHESAAALCTELQIPPAPIDGSMPSVSVMRTSMADLAATSALQDVQILAPNLPTLPPLCDDFERVLCDIPAKLTATGVKSLEQPSEDIEIDDIAIDDIVRYDIVRYDIETATQQTVAPQAQPAPKQQARRPDFAHAQGLTPAERGTAHHLFLQLCDFDACMAGRYAQELARLEQTHQLTPAQCQAIDLSSIAGFFEHADTKRWLQGKYQREVRFSVTVPACDYYPTVQDPTETVLLQGVIDCLMETEAGFVVVDYKTDNVNRHTMAARAAIYAPQVQTYGKVVEMVFAKKVAKTMLFFTKTGTYWEVK